MGWCVRHTHLNELKVINKPFYLILASEPFLLFPMMEIILRSEAKPDWAPGAIRRSRITHATKRLSSGFKACDTRNGQQGKHVASAPSRATKEEEARVVMSGLPSCSRQNGSGLPGVPV